jgi:hypothetical protein
LEINSRFLILINTMKKILFLVVFASLFLSCHKLVDFPHGHGPSSEFVKTYGGSSQDEVMSILFAHDGGYFLAGNSSSNDLDVTGNHGDYDFWAAKLDKTGSIIWQQSLGGSGFDLMSSATNSGKNGIVAVGRTPSSDGDITSNHGNDDAWVVSLDNNGQLLWQKAFGGTSGDVFQQIIQIPDGGYLCVGSTFSNDGDVSGNHGEEDGWVVGLDNSGNIEWQKTFGGSGTERFEGVTRTLDGEYLLVGLTNSTDGDVKDNKGISDAWVVKIDSEGNLQWQKTFGGTGDEILLDVTQMLDGGFLMVGSTDSNDGDVSGNHGSMDAWVLRIAKNGALKWQKPLGGSGGEELKQIAWTPHGDYLLAGQSDSNDGDVSGNKGRLDGWVIAINENGRTQWQKTFGGTNIDVLNTIAARWDGSYITGGWTSSNNEDPTFADAWVLSVK